MGKDIVMIHGANKGGWCFDTFKTVFERLGRTCHAPDLIGHGTRAADAAKTLVGVGMADYRTELEAFLETLPPKPVMLGHSMGGVLAQQLAAEGLASALILIAPAPRAGILPPTDAEEQLDQDLMGLGAFWKTVINPDFDLARIYTLSAWCSTSSGLNRAAPFSSCSSGCSTRAARRWSTPLPSNAR